MLFIFFVQTYNKDQEHGCVVVLTVAALVPVFVTPFLLTRTNKSLLLPSSWVQM